jgi:hypothetical protein
MATGFVWYRSFCHVKIFQNLFEVPIRLARDESSALRYISHLSSCFDDKQFVVDDRVADLRKVQFPGMTPTTAPPSMERSPPNISPI